MIFSRSLFILAAFSASVVHSNNCPSGGSNCKYEPFNPYACGTDYSCVYDSICSAQNAGYNINNDCCQAPQQSACGLIYYPVLCGSKQCPYENECLAELAGYSSNQCSPAPEECPSVTGCSGQPSNPFKCGFGLECYYDNTCQVQSAGFNLNDDCCQDTSIGTSCNKNYAPVSCGDPLGKQCPYNNQCMAGAAGYSDNQCCRAVPDATACAYNYDPVECGSMPCVYANQCQANAAGYATSECCPQNGSGACYCDYDNCADCLGTNSCAWSPDAGSDGECFRSCSDPDVPADGKCYSPDYGHGPSICPSAPTPTPPAARCSSDVLKCATGQTYNRDANNNCQFPDCPSTSCATNYLHCPGDEWTMRDPNNSCDFQACSDYGGCLKDEKQCNSPYSNVFVTRDYDSDSNNGCEFFDCPTSCAESPAGCNPTSQSVDPAGDTSGAAGCGDLASAGLVASSVVALGACMM